ncbi:hypothetical protein BDW22DRAFT_1096830 [Trametopsis cervina]|nr:hypothetical protein BDW22DRAFT_1096830 [Trametopsis cervina]
MALTESWRGVFAVLARLILLAPVLEGRAREEATQIELCFEWHSAVDAPTEGGDRDEEEKYLGWLAAFKPEESPIPDGLYLTLAHIFIPETRHWRVRRLQEMTLQEREAAAKDIDPFLRKSGADNIYNSIASPSTEGGTGGADAPGGGDGHDDSPSNFATGTQGLERHAVAALSLELGDTGASADPEYTDEQGEATAEDITRRNLEAADLRLRDADPQQNVPSDAETVADNADVQVTLRHGGQRLG